MSDRFDAEKISTIRLAEPIEITCTLKNHGYLFYQADSESKDRLLAAIADTEWSEQAQSFLASAGHVTLVGNFNSEDKKSFDGKKSVNGVWSHFELEKDAAASLLVAEIVVYDNGKLACARIQKKSADTVLREDLPRDKGIAKEWYEGESHMTLCVDKRNYAPKDSNDLLAALRQ